MRLPSSVLPWLSLLFAFGCTSPDDLFEQALAGERVPAIADKTPSKILARHPTIEILKNGRVTDSLTFALGDEISVRVSAEAASGVEALQYAFLREQLVFADIRDWSRQPSASLRIVREDLGYRYLKIHVKIRAGGGNYARELSDSYEAGVVISLDTGRERVAPVDPRGVTFEDGFRLALPERATPWLGEPRAESIATRMFIDAAFEERTRAYLTRMARAFMVRALDPEVLRCAWDNSWLDVPHSPAALAAQISAALPGTLRMQLAERPVRGPVGVAYAESFLYYQDGRLLIRIDPGYFGPRSDYHLAADEGFASGTIGHEILHNLGYNHRDGLTATRGYFITEYGNCFAAK